MDIKKFVERNIEEINKSINSFIGKKPNKTEIKGYLKDKYLKELPSIKNDLLKELKKHKYVKARVKDTIAKDFILYNGHLEKFYDINVFQILMEKIDNEKLVNNLLDTIKKEVNDDKAYKFIESNLSKLCHKIVHLLKLRGFSTNILGINDGTMDANSGDSAQFLFLSRGILAGFNCSNVDVRSSRYDSIIDFNGILLKIQVKGISKNKISFKERDRGGQGIDHTHETNKGKKYTSKDCDIFVAVDKQCGLCYLIPMEFVDSYSEDTIKTSDAKKFLENWEVVEKVASGK